MTEEKNGGLGRALKAFALASTITVQFAVSIMIGVYAGRYLDERLGSQPWLMLLGLFAGIAAGTAGIYRTIQHVFKRSNGGS